MFVIWICFLRDFFDFIFLASHLLIRNFSRYLFVLFLVISHFQTVCFPCFMDICSYLCDGTNYIKVLSSVSLISSISSRDSFSLFTCSFSWDFHSADLTQMSDNLWVSVYI